MRLFSSTTCYPLSICRGVTTLIVLSTCVVAQQPATPGARPARPRQAAGHGSLGTGAQSRDARRCRFGSAFRR